MQSPCTMPDTPHGFQQMSALFLETCIRYPAGQTPSQALYKPGLAGNTGQKVVFKAMTLAD